MTYYEASDGKIFDVKGNAKPVNEYSTDGKLLKTYPSLRMAAYEWHTHTDVVRRWIDGRTKNPRITDHIFKFADK